METKSLTLAFETELNLNEQGFKKLSDRKEGLLIDVKTEAGFKLARKERTEQNGIIKDIDRLAIDGKKAVDEVREELKGKVEKIFSPIVTAFEAEDILRKKKAKEKEEAETKRIQAIHDEINGIRQFSLNLVGKTSEDLQGIIEAVDMIDVSENFAELTQEAMQVKKETLGELNIALSSAIQNEQLAIQRKKLAEQELKLKAQERLNNLMMIPTTMFGKTSKEIDAKYNSIVNFEITSDEFGELVTSAEISAENVCKQLKTMFDQQVLVEQAQANQAEQQEPVQPSTQQEQIKTAVGGQLDVYETPKQPIKSRLAETFANVPDEVSKEPTDGLGPLTPKEKMNQMLRFWKDQYGVRDGEFSDLMNIINQFI